VTLTAQQLPVHSHAFLGSSDAGATTSPPSNVVAAIPGGSAYIEDQPGVAMSQLSLPVQGGSQPHENRQPYLTLSFIISLFGIFPTQS
jgi:microcystin-dependent protein